MIVYVVVREKKAQIVGDLPEDLEMSLPNLLGYHVKMKDKYGVLTKRLNTKYNRLNKTVPVGLLDRLLKIIEDFGHEAKVLDKREIKLVDPGDIIDRMKDFPYKLRPYQVQAFAKGIQEPLMTFSMATGSGKTVVFGALAGGMGLKTLILINREDILTQHFGSIKRMFPDVGLIQGSQLDFDKQICVGMVQTIDAKLKKKGERASSPKYHMTKYLESVEYVVSDECLTLDSLILLEDGGVKYLKDIQNQDRVFGGIVSDKFERYSSKNLKIQTQFSTIITSSNHLNLVGAIVPGCKAKTKIVEIKSKDLNKKIHRFLVPVKIPHTTKSQLTKDQAAFLALILADGCLDTKGSRIKISFSKPSKKFIINLFKKGIKAFGENPSDVKISTNGRNDTTIWIQSKRLKELLNQKYLIPNGKKSDKIDIPDDVFYSSLESIREFINVFISCDGDVSLQLCVIGKYKVDSIRIHVNSTSKVFSEKFKLLLKKFGIHSTSICVDKKNVKHNNQHRISIGNKNANDLLDLIDFHRESFNDLGRNKGTIPYGTIRYNNDDYILTRIKTIENVEGETVSDFTSVGSNSFIANGLLTHNCHHSQSATWKRIVRLCNNKQYHHGFSGSPWDRGSANLDLECVCGAIKFKVTSSDLIRDGYLSIPHVFFHEYKGSNEEITGGSFQELYTNSIVDCTARNKAIVKVVEQQYNETDNKILVIVNRIKHGEILSTMLRRRGIDDRELGYLHGGKGKLVREKGKKKFERGDIRILIASQIFNEGIDIPSCDVLVKADALGGGESVYESEGVRSFVQQIGRVLRKPVEEGDVDTSTPHHVYIHDFIDRQNKYVLKHTENRIKTCKMEPGFIVHLDERSKS